MPKDMRLPSSRAALAQRSVNLAISSRGLAALYSVDRPMMDRVLENVIPMKGRMVHTGDGKTESQAYDPNGQVRIIDVTFGSKMYQNNAAHQYSPFLMIKSASTPLTAGFSTNAF